MTYLPKAVWLRFMGPKHVNLAVWLFNFIFLETFNGHDQRIKWLEINCHDEVIVDRPGGLKCRVKPFYLIFFKNKWTIMISWSLMINGRPTGSTRTRTSWSLNNSLPEFHLSTPTPLSFFFSHTILVNFQYVILNFQFYFYSQV